jgi:hypothetical protein
LFRRSVLIFEKTRNKSPRIITIVSTSDEVISHSFPYGAPIDDECRYTE